MSSSTLLNRRSLPTQDRSARTVELILHTTGDLLGETGFERLSTNMICKACGLTPPALYRYFPNKYAVLSTLAEGLMEVQDAALTEWLHNDLGTRPVEQSLRGMLDGLVGITRAYPGGVWLARTMRAVPALAEISGRSEDHMTAAIGDALIERFPHHDEALIRRRVRTAIECGTALIEYAVTREADDLAVLDDGAEMIAGLITRTVPELAG